MVNGDLVDLVFHVLLPVMLGLTANVDRKKVFMLAPIALIPDVDALLMAHRVYLHTIFIPLFIAVIPFFMNVLGLKEYKTLFWLASFYYLSHIILDFFPGPVAILWPLTDNGYGVWVAVIASQQSVFPAITPYFAPIFEQANTSNGITDVSIVTPQSIALTALFLVVIIMRPIHNWLKKAEHKKPLFFRSSLASKLLFR